MEVEAGLLEGQAAEVQDAPHLGFQVVDHVLVHHAQDEAGDHPVPVVHQPYIGPVVAPHFLQAVSELLTLAEQLFEATETAGHGVAPGVDHPGIGQYQANETDMQEIVRHLVDEQGRFTPVDPGILDVLFPEAPEIVLLQFVQDGGVPGCLLGFTPAQFLRQGQYVVQFHGAVHHAVGRQDLFQQGRAGTGQADDKDRVAAVKSGALPARKQFAGAGLNLCLHARLHLFNPVAGLAQLQAVALFITGEGFAVLPAVFQGLASGKTQVDPVGERNTGGIRVTPDGVNLLVRECIGLGVGQAPVGVAVIRPAPVCLPVGPDGLVQQAHGLPGVTCLYVQLGAVRVGFQDIPVQGNPLFEPAQTHERGCQGALEARVAGFLFQQQLCLFMGFFKAGLPDQDVDVIDAGLHVVRREFHAAFQEELRIVVDAHPHPDLGQQAHGLDMVPVFLQVVPAQQFRLVKFILVNQVEDVDQFRGQPVEEIQPFPRQPGLFRPAQAFFEIDERLQARLQRRVQFNCPGVCRGGVFAAVDGQEDMAAFLVRSGMVGIAGEQGLQGRQRRLAPVVIPLRDRQQVQRLHPVVCFRIGGKQLFQRCDCVAEPGGLNQLFCKSQVFRDAGLSRIHNSLTSAAIMPMETTIMEPKRTVRL